MSRSRITSQQRETIVRKAVAERDAMLGPPTASDDCLDVLADLREQIANCDGTAQINTDRADLLLARFGRAPKD